MSSAHGAPGVAPAGKVGFSLTEPLPDTKSGNNDKTIFVPFQNQLKAERAGLGSCSSDCLQEGGRPAHSRGSGIRSLGGALQ